MKDKELLISVKNKNRENKVFKNICKCIENKKSFVFDAGAGSGKTYSLIQSLKYIIDMHGKYLKSHNQKIICITYTNVAVSEIKERLGNTSLALISTIHECLWTIIKPYKKQLLRIHREKLKLEIEIMENQLGSQEEKWNEKYRNLSKESQRKLLNIMYENKEIYYQYKNESAEKVRGIFSELLNEFDIMKNIAHFTKIVDNILKIERYQRTLKKSFQKIKNFKLLSMMPDIIMID